MNIVNNTQRLFHFYLLCCYIVRFKYLVCHSTQFFISIGTFFKL